MKFWGTDPKNLRVFTIFGLWSGYAAVAALEAKGRDSSAATFGVVRRGSSDLLYLGRVTPPHFAKSGGNRLR